MQTTTKSNKGACKGFWTVFPDEFNKPFSTNARFVDPNWMFSLNGFLAKAKSRFIQQQKLAF